jgi:SMI1 / KNR4 family (SUKH-1)
MSLVNSDRLISYWRGGAVPLDAMRAPASRASLTAFEVRTNGKLPDSVREYFLYSNGFEHDGRDERGFRFWPIEEICDLNEFDDGLHGFESEERKFLFCDYLDFSWGYAFRFNSLEDVSVFLVGLDSKVPRLIATSFSEFIALYVSNDERLYP